MEDDSRNFRLTIAAFELLDQLTAITAEDLDNVATDRGRSDQCTVIIDSDGADFSALVRNNSKVDALIDNCQVRNSLLTKVQHFQVAALKRG